MTRISGDVFACTCIPAGKVLCLALQIQQIECVLANVLLLHSFKRSKSLTCGTGHRSEIEICVG